MSSSSVQQVCTGCHHTSFAPVRPVRVAASGADFPVRPLRGALTQDEAPVRALTRQQEPPQKMGFFKKLAIGVVTYIVLKKIINAIKANTSADTAIQAVLPEKSGFGSKLKKLALGATLLAGIIKLASRGRIGLPEAQALLPLAIRFAQKLATKLNLPK